MLDRDVSLISVGASWRPLTLSRDRRLTAKVDQVLPLVNEHGAQIDQFVPTITMSKERLDSPKLEKLAINKPFECRSAVVRSPSFRPMREGYICCSAGVLLRAKGKTAGAELGEPWQP